MFSEAVRPSETETTTRSSNQIRLPAASGAVRAILVLCAMFAECMILASLDVMAGLDAMPLSVD